MITIGIDNTLELGSEAVEYIHSFALKRGIHVHHIAPKESTIYRLNRVFALKDYYHYLEEEGKTDILIIELNKRGIETNIYKNLGFNIIVLFDEKVEEEKGEHKIIKKYDLVEKLKSKYYVLPDTYKIKTKGCITYGWSQEADISVSSAEKTVEGLTELQCCIQTCIPSIKGSITMPVEFPVKANINNVDSVLAGVATILLYGLNINT